MVIAATERIHRRDRKWLCVLTDHAVVYLARAANPPRHFKAFIECLRRFKAGRAFDLIIIAKGFGAARPDIDTRDIDGLSRVIFFDIDDETFATNAFFITAREFSYKVFQFHVSWSRPCADGWLSLMLEALEQDPNIGVVGASGGFEQLNAETLFPNPNIRTTGFLIDRQSFLSLNPGPLLKKYDGNLFEAGPNSLTRQVVSAGKRPVVVGRTGQIFEIDEWPRSLTFRSGTQSNLLIADNRTQHYAIAGMTKRRSLATLNYGKGAYVAGTNLFQRLIYRLSWRFSTGV